MSAQSCERTGWQRHWAGALVALVTLAGAAIRFHGLGSKPLWSGEIQEITSARSPRFWAQVLDSGTDVVGYAWHHVVWRLGLRPEEGVTRLVAALAGTATILVIYRLGTLLHSRTAGLVAAILLSTSFFHVYHSQDARAVAHLTFFYALSWLAMAEVFWNNRTRWAPVYAISAGLAGLSHSLGGLYLVVQAAFFLALALTGRQPWEHARRYLFAALGALPLCAIQLFVVADYAFAFSVTRLPVQQVMEVEDLFLLRLLAAWLAGGSAVATLVALVLAAWGLAARAGRTAVLHRAHAAWMLATWLVAPVVVLYAAAVWVRVGRFEMYHLLPVLVPFLLLAALGLADAVDRAARRIAQTGRAAITLAVAAALAVAANAPALTAWYDYPVRLFQGEDFRAVGAYLDTLGLDGRDLILTNYSEHMVPLNFYAGKSLVAARVAVPWVPENGSWRYHLLLRAEFQQTDSDVVRLEPDGIRHMSALPAGPGSMTGRVVVILPWVQRSIADRGLAPQLEWLSGNRESLLADPVPEGTLPAGYTAIRFPGVTLLVTDPGPRDARAEAARMTPLLVSAAPPLLRDMAPSVYGPL